MDNTKFFAIFALILLAGFYIRFYDLTNRPMHHDEGVIGWFKLNIVTGCFSSSVLSNPLEWAKSCGASYGYDPDYHGPFEYLFGAWMFKLFGDSDFTLRAPECLFGFATIALLLPLRKKLGDVGILVAAALLATSPSMAYFAQRAYMDNFFIFFTLGAVVCAVKFWDEGKRLWLYLGAADLALLFTTKETAFIFVFIAMAFAVIEYFYSLRKKSGLVSSTKEGVEEAWKFCVRNKSALLAAALIFAAIYSFVYSTMFTDPGEVWNGVTKGLTFWLQRSTTWEGHFKPFGYYYGLLADYEPAVLFLAAAGVFFGMRNSFARWCALWAFATWLIFSLIPYKTPWLDPHFIIPMAMVAGIGVDEVVKKLKGGQRYLPALVVIPLLVLSWTMAWDITYVKYAGSDIQLVYVSGTDGYTELVDRIENESLRFDGVDTAIAVVSTDYWPLPWSLRKYKHAAWYGKSTPELDTPFVISSRTDFSEIKPGLREQYSGPVQYEIRQGVYVWLYERR